MCGGGGGVKAREGWLMTEVELWEGGGEYKQRKAIRADSVRLRGAGGSTLPPHPHTHPSGNQYDHVKTQNALQ